MLVVCVVAYGVSMALPGPIWRTVAALALVLGVAAWLRPRARRDGWKRTLVDVGLQETRRAASVALVLALILLAGSSSPWLSIIGRGGIVAAALVLVLGWIGRQLLPEERDLSTSTRSPGD